MNTAATYEERIQALDWDGLRALLDGIKLGSTPGWEPGKALEYLVLRVFQLDRAEVKWPYSVEHAGQVLEQIDGVIHLDEISCLVESKDRTEKLNFEPVAKLLTQLARRPPATFGSVFSKAGFTFAAKALARWASPVRILLWEMEELEFLVEQKEARRFLIKKYRYATEYGIPYFNVRALKVTGEV